MAFTRRLKRYTTSDRFSFWSKNEFFVNFSVFVKTSKKGLTNCQKHDRMLVLKLPAF